MNNEEYKYLELGFYGEIKEIIERSRKRIYKNIQNEMLFAYWQIGKMIVEKQGGDNRAKYGDRLIKELSIRMVEDFGKGFSERILRLFGSFICYFQFGPQ